MAALMHVCQLPSASATVPPQSVNQRPLPPLPSTNKRMEIGPSCTLRVPPVEWWRLPTRILKPLKMLFGLFDGSLPTYCWGSISVGAGGKRVQKSPQRLQQCAGGWSDWSSDCCWFSNKAETAPLTKAIDGGASTAFSCVHQDSATVRAAEVVDCCGLY